MPRTTPTAARAGRGSGHGFAKAEDTFMDDLEDKKKDEKDDKKDDDDVSKADDADSMEDDDETLAKDVDDLANGTDLPVIDDGGEEDSDDPEKTIDDQPQTAEDIGGELLTLSQTANGPAIAKAQQRMTKAMGDLMRLAKAGDPAMRKQALLAKSWKGGKLSGPEAAELMAHVQGRPVGAGLDEQVAKSHSQSRALAKAQAENSALVEVVQGLHKGQRVLAAALQKSLSEAQEIQFLTARAINTLGTSMTEMVKGQRDLAKGYDGLMGQPAHAPLSKGIRADADYHEKSLGRIVSKGPKNIAKAKKVLEDMLSKSNGSDVSVIEGMHDLALYGEVSPEMQSRIQTHLAEAS